MLWESGRARSLPLPPPTADDFVVYLHIDFDVLDPRFFESVGYPTPGGLIRRRSEVVSNIQQDRRRRHHREVRRAQGLGPRHRRRPSHLTSCASVRQPVQLVRQGFGDGTDAAV
ncbi:arginase family protein [Nonomuraea angiospora]|uniref:arginase family protein n=1 Tax=Nonomuraea angiospora TaxID=46172 RepID=UPI00332FE304